ncbi:MAG: ABC transporter ATP-binding protein [Treponemataceae bacterium]|nr:ABC transporter ATP-binding protein [Treponemataceae bacterium]
MIELKSFSKQYGKKTVVKDVSFICPDHEITALIGANGAGKTTILKGICAIHYPSSGSIYVNGLSVEESSAETKGAIGYVSENASFPENYFVMEYLIECADIWEKTGKKVLEGKKAKTERISRIIETFSLEEVLKKRIYTLSKGYRQRLSFAQAFIHDPSVLVLDEPVTGLDPLQISEIRSIIKKAGKTKTVLMSTHFMQEAETICGRIVFLHDGQKLAEGSIDEVLKSAGADNLESAFIRLTKTEIH